MDPKTSSPDVRRCDLCKTALAQMHCNMCLIKLCKACVGEHISTDESKDHNVVNFQAINSTPLYPECAIHIKERCEMYCKHCDVPVCPTCLASDQHFCHKLSKILQVRDEMKELIRKQQYELNEKIYPTYKGIAGRVQFRMSQLEKDYEDLLTTITEHEVDRHKKIEEFVKKLKSQVNIIKTSQLQTLQKHLDEINKKSVDIKADINALNNAADSDEISTPVLVRSNIALYKKLPQEPVLSVPKFSPTKWIDFSKTFGALSPIPLTSEKYGLSQKTAKKFPDQKPSELDDFQHPVKQLLEKPFMIGERKLFNLGTPQNVARLKNGAFWISGKSSTMIKFSISSDRILKQVSTKSGNSPTDIAVSRSGDLIYTDYWNRTVNIVKNEDIEEVIKVQNWRPQCACSTSFGDLLVILDSDDNKQSKVAQYFGSKERLSIQNDDEGKPLYSSGGSHKYIIENRNLDICVADSGAKAVVVVNLTGKLRFRYTGHSSAQKNKPFSPEGITTDSVGQILTIDNTDNISFIHIINEDGQFLRHINCGPRQLYCWCIDTNDYLFILHHRKYGFLFSSSFVGQLKYLK